ncbi:hypothetical protein GCM10010377_72670 [Streptomyces viridiviolaceus]|nr:hypothetical protein GCM10010377_72670 [Streptomyces viridiviolaceus]
MRRWDYRTRKGSGAWGGVAGSAAVWGSWPGWRAPRRGPLPGRWAPVGADGLLGPGDLRVRPARRRAGDCGAGTARRRRRRAGTEGFPCPAPLGRSLIGRGVFRVLA